MKNWQTERSLGEWLIKIGQVCCYPGYLLSYPGLWLMDQGDKMVMKAMNKKFDEEWAKKPAPSDNPNFTKSTEIEL